MLGRHRLVEFLQRHDVFIQRYSSSFELHPYLHRLMTARGVEAVADVGANRGQFAIQLRRHGFLGTIVSYEPHPDAIGELLRRAAKDPLWEVRPTALGTSMGTAELYVYSERGDLNSLREASEVGEAMWGGAMAGAPSITVPTSRLDEDWVEDCPWLLKTDTQGFDLDVIEGAAGVISSCAAIVTEVAITHLYRDAPAFGDIMRRLEEEGFELSALHPVLRSEDGLRLFEADAVFLRRR